MTRSLAAGLKLAQGWNFSFAARHGDGTARMKRATARRMNGRRHVAGENDALALRVGIHDRHRREQRLGVRMFRRATEAPGFARFDDATEIHHEDAVADVFHHREIVRNEQVSDAALASAASRRSGNNMDTTSRSNDALKVARRSSRRRERSSIGRDDDSWSCTGVFMALVGAGVWRGC